MSLLTPRLTEEGIAMVVAALNGDSITFTKAIVGKTTTEPAHPEQLTDVVSPMVTAVFTAITEGTNYVSLAAVFDNTEIETGAYASELGLYAENSNGDEKLYAYTYVGENADYIPANDSGRTVQNQMTIVVAIGDAETVDAVLIDAAAYATREEFEAHINDHNNPHEVTKEQVGLGLVENNYFVDNDIVVDELATAANVATGDTLRQAMSKIWYWIQKIINGTAGYIPLSGYGDVLGSATSNTGITGDIWFADRGSNQGTCIGGRMSDNDFWRIYAAGDPAINPNVSGSGSGQDCGYLEIATADNGNEPIIVRQYGLTNQGDGFDFKTVVRTLYLLDHQGNTTLPGDLQIFGFGSKTRGLKLSSSPAPNPTGTTDGDGAFVGCITDSTGNTNLEIGVADDGNEMVIVRQRKNTGSSGGGIGGSWDAIPIHRTAYLLNGSGNTIFPGSCTATSHPTSSDLKKKKVHGEISLDTAEKLIMGLKPILYNFIGDWKESAGFGAQDVYKLIHELGMKDNSIYRATMMPDKDGNTDGIEYHDSNIDARKDADIEWSLNYPEFIPYIVRVIQSQQERLDDQEKRIETLEKKLGGA